MQSTYVCIYNMQCFFMYFFHKSNFLFGFILKFFTKVRNAFERICYTILGFVLSL